MSKKRFHIFGQIITDRDKQGVADLRVEVWDKDLIFNDLIGSTVTDAEGRFQKEFDASYFRESFLDRRPDLFFKVFRGEKLIASTEDSVLWNLDAGEREMVIELDIPRSPA